MDNAELKKELFITTKKIKKLLFRHSLGHVNHSEYMILKLIDEWCKNHEESSDGIKMSDLAERMRVSKPAVSKLINSLEEKGDIVRIFGKKDKRTIFIQLTEHGKKKTEECIRRMDKTMQNVLDKMGEEDSLELIRLLNKLYGIIESEMNLLNEEENKGCE